MNTTLKVIATCVLLAMSATALAQSDNEKLKIAALEALMSAPPERALPIVQKVLKGNDSVEIKSRALFILSQIDEPEAQAVLVDAARNNTGELRMEAIRMIGISGDPTALAALGEIYAAGDEESREAVLDAYMISDDVDAVYQIALNTDDPDELEAAVDMLAAMNATEQLRGLRERIKMSEALVRAYAITGDAESLRELEADSSDPEIRLEAISSLGIVGGDDVNLALVEIYRGAASDDVREAALHGLLIADYDEGVLALFRESQDAEEKQELLQQLVMMDSEAVWDIIDATLDEQQ